MGNNHDNYEQKLRGWGFRFFGEAGRSPDDQQDAAIAVELDGKEYLSLINVKVGDRLWIVKLNGSEGMVCRLIGMGLLPGTELQIISTTGSSVIVALNDNRIGLSEGMAKAIACSREPLPQNVSLTTTAHPETTQMNSSHLRDLTIGTRGRVIGYEKAARSYKGKLLAMGLTPGTEFTVTRHAPLGDPIEIQVRDFNLSLRKDEANALCVEEVKNA